MLAGTWKAFPGPLQVILNVTEKSLRDDLAESGASPFLGHHTILLKRITPIKDFVCKANDPAERFCTLLAGWPTVGVGILAHLTAEFLGKHQGIELWPWIDNYFGKPVLLGRRSDLYRAFRSACLRLGLPVLQERDGCYIVNEFVLQAGVPFNQLSALAEACARTERLEGLPNVDDTAECAAWSAAVAHRLPNNGRLVLILSSEGGDYYARAYAAIRQNMALQENRFLQRFRDALNELALDAPTQGGSSTAQFAKPTVILRDETLILGIPPSQDLWTVVIDGRSAEVDAGADGGEMVLTQPWPDAIMCHRDNHTPIAIPILARRPDAIAMFHGETGELVKAAHLDQTGTTLRLHPGPYLAVGRRGFCCDGEDSEAGLGPLHFLRFTLLSQGVQITSPYGHLTLAAGGASHLGFAGQHAVDLAGRRLFAAADVALTLVLPGDRLAAPYDLVLDGMAKPDGTAADALRVPVQRDDLENGRALVGAHLAHHPAMVIRLRASLCLRGESRALASAVAFVWSGLDGCRPGRGFRGQRPGNALPDLFDGASLGDTGIGFHSGRTGEPVRVAFRPVGRDAGRAPWTFRFQASDLFVELVRSGDVSAALRTVQVSLGETVAISDDQPADIIVHSDDHEADLSIGQRRIQGAFQRALSRHIAHATLMEACTGAANAITIHKGRERSVAIELCRIARPYTPRRFQIDDRPGRVSVTMDLGRPIHSLCFDGVDLRSGHTVAGALEPGMVMVAPNSPLASASLAGGAGTGYVLTVPYGMKAASFWLLHPAVRMEGNAPAEPLRNPRSDEYVLAVAGEWGNRITDPVAVDCWTTINEAAGVALRCYAALLRCYEQQSWDRMSWLPGLMRRAANAVIAEQGLSPLVPAFAQQPAEGASESWVPLTSPWDLAPGLWSLPGSAYARLPETAAPLLRALHSLAKLDAAGRVREAIAQGLIGPAFARYYGNLQEAHRSDSVRLSQFDFDQFVCEMSRPAIQDESNDTRCPLSARRHRDAVRRLRLAYGRISNGESNLIRLGRATHMVNRCSSAQPELVRWVHRVAKGWTRAGVPALPVTAAEEEASDFLSAAPNLLSSLAMAARFDRLEPGLLDDYLARLGKITEEDPAATLGFVTWVAPDLFGFYLVLWDVLSRSVKS